MESAQKEDIHKIVKFIKFYRLFCLFGGLINSVLIGLHTSRIFAKLPDYAENILLYMSIGVSITFVFFLYKNVKKYKVIALHPLYKDALNSVDMKIANEQTDLLVIPNMLASILVIVLVFARKNSSNLPPFLYLAFFFAIAVIGYWLLSLAQRASKQVRNDEFNTLKSKDIGYFGYFLSLILLVAMLLTMIWMPEVRVQLIKYSHGYEVEIVISLSIFTLLLGGLLGRFVTWDKYR